jgi:hypothetical protein
MTKKQREELKHLIDEINAPKSRIMELMDRIEAISPARARRLGRIIGKLATPMRSLASMSMADLREVVRKNPEWREIAWAEIKFRNQARQAFERENGVRPGTKVEPWFPPDLTPPGPLPKD